MEKTKGRIFFSFFLTVIAGFFLLGSSTIEPVHREGRQLINLVREAAKLIEQKGESCFSEFKKKGGKWLHGDTYVFVIDTKGFVFVNPSRPELEGKEQISLKDLMGKPFIRSFINETTGYPFKNEGWTHYVWYKPGEEMAMWKTSYVKLVKAPSGKDFIVGSGLYDIRMEKAFVVDVVDEAADLIKKKGKQAFAQIRDPLGDFNYLTTYVFVIDSKGMDLVNPVFPGFEGQNVLDLKDSEGKYFIKDMIRALESTDTVWIEYMWPKPRHAVPTKKSTYVRKVLYGEEVFYVGSGVYLD
ncbi:MAG TPA: cache domain-containing protein [Syntrophorhabdus sp.]|jgi:signal transduction histidine kinase|nr:cache domain-containing protein [Syntrophorhabdus sp.]MDI9557001.1 cache domain-containing protein [Pseudomonadota bacterium]OPX99694.1 MAG: Cache domain protein [Syntrophorhabdus sp. PtaB.Bin027]OQB77729.1 MAG: Cache domain protein [Deltaproteobacteria bacterium ADurb.Bin135]HNS77055.1 cache domain-containing protein [Syntrophorhabdus sp.]